MTQRKSIAVVTGAGSGIGRASATALAKKGFALVLAGRRQTELEAVAADIAAAGGEAISIPTDVSEDSAVEQLFRQVGERYGRLDLLFNNAGFWPAGALLEEMDVATWRKAMDVNVTGTFLCTQHAVRMMKAQQPQGGRIINNGSVAAQVPRPKSASYTTAKHAITGLTKATSLEGRDFDIACGQIDIGNAATEMTQAMASGAPQADGRVVAEARMDVAHVADAVVYMAGLPLSANVLFMTLLPPRMPFVGRG